MHSARFAYKGMKRENRDERMRITYNGGALVAELTVAGGDSGVVTVVLLWWQTVVVARRGRKEKKSVEADDGDSRGG
jgi:hypothetical protein